MKYTVKLRKTIIQEVTVEVDFGGSIISAMDLAEKMMGDPTPPVPSKTTSGKWTAVSVNSNE